MFPKLLVTQGQGLSWSYFPTGHENDLLEWIVTSKNFSISFGDLIEKSLNLTDVNVYKAIMPTLQVLLKI